MTREMRHNLHLIDISFFFALLLIIGNILDLIFTFLPCGDQSAINSVFNFNFAALIVFKRHFHDSGVFWPGWTEECWEEKLNGNFIVIDIFWQEFENPMFANFFLQIIYELIKLSLYYLGLTEGYAKKRVTYSMQLQNTT